MSSSPVGNIFIATPYNKPLYQTKKYLNSNHHLGILFVIIIIVAGFIYFENDFPINWGIIVILSFISLSTAFYISSKSLSDSELIFTAYALLIVLSAYFYNTPASLVLAVLTGSVALGLMKYTE